MSEQYTSPRRDFLKRASLGGLVALGLPELLSASVPQHSAGRLSLPDGAVILFQGDSITDAGRNKEAAKPNNGAALGGGYAFLASCEMLFRFPGKKLSIYNKGISGNKVFQLAERWEKDCLELKPDILSILIGVNDYWHKHNGNYDGTVEVYKKDYRALLERTLKALPNVQLVIGEPFAVKAGTAVDDSWYPEFDAYRAAAKEIAAEFKARFIPYQSIFDKAEKLAEGTYWAPDGVHPSLAGASLMADAWVKTVAG